MWLKAYHTIIVLSIKTARLQLAELILLHFTGARPILHVGMGCLRMWFYKFKRIHHIHLLNVTNNIFHPLNKSLSLLRQKISFKVGLFWNCDVSNYFIYLPKLFENIAQKKNYILRACSPFIFCLNNGFLTENVEQA